MNAMDMLDAVLGITKKAANLRAIGEQRLNALQARDHLAERANSGLHTVRAGDDSGSDVFLLTKEIALEGNKLMLEHLQRRVDEEVAAILEFATTVRNFAGTQS